MTAADMAVSMLLLLLSAVTQDAVDWQTACWPQTSCTLSCVCGPSHTDISRQQDISSSGCHAQRWMSPATLSVILCLRRTICKRRTYYWEIYTRVQDGRFNCSDQAEMTLQTHQFYSRVTLCLCGTKRGQLKREDWKSVGQSEVHKIVESAGRFLMVATENSKLPK